MSADPFDKVAYLEGQTAGSMVPSGPCHVAIIVSLTADLRIHTGMSAHVRDTLGEQRADALLDTIAQAFALAIEPRQ